MKVVIDGNIGCGKTTLIKRLNDDIRIPIFLEPLHKWNDLLTLFYDDPKKWAFPFNLEVITSFHEWKSNAFPAIYERSPLSCRKVFTQLNVEMGHMHTLELGVFDKIYKELSWMPDVLIYIRTDPQTCSQRMQERARECEKHVPLDYIQSIHTKYEMMVKEITTPTYVVDGNQSKDKVYEDVKKIVQVLL
jgi:thymidine kinase